MTEQNQPRMVNCRKIGRELPGLNRPPRNDELGQRIYNEISKQGWDLWLEQQTILINHYGLNLADPNAHKFLSEQMEDFLFGENARVPEDWIPPDETPSGAPPVKGAAPTKGAPTPQRK
jgi:Fe-S cluster biosynthesis and repair protein YggX